MTFGERLKKLRENHNPPLSREDLANVADIKISYWAIAKYETNERQPDYDTLKKFANFFDVSIDYLLGQSDSPRPSPDPREIVAAHRTDGDDYKKDLPPEAVAEIEMYVDYIRHKYKKQQPDGNK